MDSGIQLNESVLRGKFTLPADATIVNVADLDESTRIKIGAESDDDIAITRASVRSTSRVVDADFGGLISGFRSPTSIPVAVAKFCKDNPQQAEQVLQDALPILLDLVQSCILVSEHQTNQQPIEFRFAVGDQIASYRVKQRLQLFSDSEVYQVCSDTGKILALKIARPHCSKQITLQLQTEAEVIRRIGLADSLYFVAKGELDNCFWFVMSWVSGSRIDIVAAEHRDTNNWQSLQELFVNVLQRFQWLHENGFLHGDIHPGNILVDSNNQPHVIDFGNAVRLHQPQEQSKESANRGGVAFYFEPEYAQAVLDRQPLPHVTALSEQFALSALIYFLSTGNYYDNFELEHVAMFHSIANPRPKPFADQGQTSWPDLEKCLITGLAQDPRQRFEKLAVMVEQLDRCALPTNTLPRHPDAEQFADFVAQLEQLISIDSELFGTEFSFGPSCSLNGGAAGIAYALYKFARCRESADLLSQAELWYARARSEQHHEHAFKNIKYSREYELVGCVSAHHAAPGISFIGLLISLSKNDYNRFEAELVRFVEEIDQPCEQTDATLGKLSVLLAIAEIIENLQGSDAEFAIDLLRSRGSQLLDDIWSGLDPGSVIGDDPDRQNLGFAHGWAGLIYTTLLWHVRTAKALPEDFYARVNQLTLCLHPSGRGLAVEWRDEQGNSLGTMSGWCNGSAGLVHVFCLLFEYDNNPEWLAIAEGLAWHTWESQSSAADLCCGAAGGIFALLTLAKCLPAGESWLGRAKKLAWVALEQSEVIRDEEHPEYSLFKGQLGIAIALESILTNGNVTMPMMGLA